MRVRHDTSSFYGRHIGGAHLLNLNQCKECGTCNPSAPGEGLVETCSGCGGPLNASGITVSAAKFTPPKIRKDDDDRLEGMSQSHRNRVNRDRERVAERIHANRERYRGTGAAKDGQGKTKKRHN